jgi:hypothetical protein
MKLNPNQSSTQQLIFKRPNPPTPEAVEKAQFIDKTYQWKGTAANKAADVQPSV